jgi:hypothetical protein
MVQIFSKQKSQFGQILGFRMENVGICIFPPVLVYCVKKNLATLLLIPGSFFKDFLQHLFFSSTHNVNAH